MKTIETTLTLFFLLLLCSYGAFAQKESSLSMEAYVDSYYAIYDDPSTSNTFQRFSTVGARDKTIGLNIAQLSFSYKSKNIRSTVTAHTGDIQRATWSSAFPFVQEANVGVHIFPNWWLDAGFFTTHIGTESFLPKNNMLSSTSIITYNEPFYQAGAKLAYEGSEKFDLEFWLLNGYNQFVDNNSAKSYGLLFTYNFHDNLSVTYTNLFGRESQDNANTVNFITYQNIYLNYENTRIKAVVGADFSTANYKTSAPNIETNENLLAFLATLRIKLTDKISFTTRFESQKDETGYITGTYRIEDSFVFEGINMLGITGGFEYAPTSESYLRVESRYLKNRDEKLIVFNGDSPYNRMEYLITLGTTFSKEW